AADSPISRRRSSPARSPDVCSVRCSASRSATGGRRAIAGAASKRRPRMPELTVRIKKKTDGNAALSCRRADGTVTWQRQEGGHGVFFPLHDLTHFAVETVLGFRRAFYGLVAEGWDISTFEERGIAARLPEDAGLAEVIVGFFDAERASGTISSADDFN